MRSAGSVHYKIAGDRIEIKRNRYDLIDAIDEGHTSVNILGCSIFLVAYIQRRY
jgi:hypothetical protein